MAPMGFDEAYIIALWTETFLYGVNSVLVWACLFVLTCMRRETSSNKFLIAIVIIQYLVSTTDISLGLVRGIVAFIDDAGQPDGPTTYLMNVTSPLNIAHLMLSCTNSILNDCVIVWRCYHVWGKNYKVIIFPVLLVIATLACGIGQGISFRTAREGHNEFNNQIQPWVEAFSLVTLATNVVGTSLIAFRIWSVLRIRSVGPSYSRLLILLIESGMLFSASLVIGLVLYLLRTVSFFIVYAMYCQLSSIIPTMILLLVGLKLTSNDVHLKMSNAIEPVMQYSTNTRTTTPSPANHLVIDITPSTTHHRSPDYDCKDQSPQRFND